jgi:four helix bundle protein
MRLDEFTAWRAARDLASDIYRITRGEAFATDATLRFEMRDRAASIMTSLAAAYEHHDCAGFRESLSSAAGAAAELQSLLYLAQDAGLLADPPASPLHRRVISVKQQVQAVDRAAVRYERLGHPDLERTASQG